MRFIKSLLILSTAGIMSISAQNKTFTLGELIPGAKEYIRVQNMDGTQWFDDVLSVRVEDQIFAIDKNGVKSETPFITLEQLNQAIHKEGLKTLKGLPQLSYTDNHYGEKKNAKFAYFFIDEKMYAYDYVNQQVILAFRGDKNLGGGEFNQNRTYTAVNKDNRLFVVNSKGKAEEISDDKKDIVWGQSVHRNEFGINGGIFWSPNGDKLAFYRMDESMVTDYPLVDISKRCAELASTKYPMAGMSSHEVTVGIYNTASNRTIYLQTGEPKDKYLTNIAWTPDQSRIIIAELNREQNKMDLNIYNASTGEFEKTLFSETSDKYVEPENPVRFIPGKKDQLIWESEKDGYNHFYLYDMTGKQLRQITSGNWIVKQFVGFDKKGENIFYYSTEVSPLEQHLYKVNIKNGKRTRLTLSEGYHYVSLNQSRTAFADRYSAAQVAGKTDLVNISNTKSVNLHTAENPYKDYKMPDISIGTIKAADSETDLYYRLVKPVNFKDGEKYPTIVYLYNGPHNQLVMNSWNAAVRGWDIYMAQKGYVVFTIDGRGSDNRGRDFEQAIFHKVGQQEGLDQMKGIEFLKTQPFVDQNRIGIHGWSYGGFMTTYMMLTYPETFKVGVAGGPVIDWKYYEIMYGERYMGQPQTNPEGYEHSNLCNIAKNLKGELLIIHGDVDPVVVMQHSLSFLKQCVKDNVYPDFLVYPGHQHNVLGPDRVHLYEKISRYFDKNLK